MVRSTFDRLRGFRSKEEKEAFERALKKEQEKIRAERVRQAAKRGSAAARQGDLRAGRIRIRPNPQAAQNFIGFVGSTQQVAQSRPVATTLGRAPVKKRKTAKKRTSTARRRTTNRKRKR